MSWNINGVYNKLEAKCVCNYLCQFDIICLNEIKTDTPFTVPGYNPVLSTANNHYHRGGCAVLIKSTFAADINNIDCSRADRISFELRSVSNTVFICIYVPPANSPYFSFDNLAWIRGQIESMPDKLFVVIGDMNAHFGSNRRIFIPKEKEHSWSYAPSTRAVKSNPNTTPVIDALGPLVMVNGLCLGDKSFDSAPTFRRTEWISELDFCFVSEALIPQLCEFKINKDTKLPSDHAPIECKLNKANINQCNIDCAQLFDHMVQLGCYSHTQSPSKHSKRWNVEEIDAKKFQELLANIPDTNDVQNIEQAITNFESMLHDCARQSKRVGISVDKENGDVWSVLAQKNDHKEIWASINWLGKVGKISDSKAPSETEFKLHFESLLNPSGVEKLTQDMAGDCPSMPITDSPFTPYETDLAIRRLKNNKSGGLSGIPPGFLKLLTPNWIVFVTLLFNFVMNSAIIPAQWVMSRLVVLYKKGSREICDNYRGISIMDSIAKLFDMMLCQRLVLWFKPNREQAGAQKNRGCIEHIVTLRLLVDYAVCKKLPLFIIFVDFTKAYDKVPRSTLFYMMKRLGCGSIMLMAIIGMYMNTSMALGAAMITTAIGVRQGSPTSCFLFTLYVDQLVRNMKELCEPDGYLGWLHLLLLMDDTVILATNKQRAEQKLGVLVDFCKDYGMVINPSKTKFMVIGADPKSNPVLKYGGLTVSNCEIYTYLGAVFTQDGKVKSAIDAHYLEKSKHVQKFISFISKNIDFPFWIKHKVFDAALMSALLYSAEAWLAKDIAHIETAYMTLVKTLLGVRKTTANAICRVELGIPTLSAKVRKIQKDFFARIIPQRTDMPDDPFNHVWVLCNNSNTKAAIYIRELLEEEDPIISDRTKTREKLKNVKEEATKLHTYSHIINPTLVRHPVYSTTCNLFERDRIIFTRLRTSSHNLRIETGRWSRTPRNRRLCLCGEIQTESHILIDCPHTETLRLESGASYPDIQSLFNEPNLKHLTRSVAKIYEYAVSL